MTVNTMPDDLREDLRAIVNVFLQHKSMEQTQDYLARGRRFVKFDVQQLSENWIIAVRSWLAHKDHTNERTMDGLASELRLRGLEPPYGTVARELADRSAQTKEPERRKAVEEIAREINEFICEIETSRCCRDLCWNWVTRSPAFREYRVRPRGQLADRWMFWQAFANRQPFAC